MHDEEPVTDADTPPPTTRPVMFIGGVLHAQVRHVELGAHGDGPELVLPPVWHDVATGTSYALRSMNMVLRDATTSAVKAAYDLPLFVALDVDATHYLAMVGDSAMQYMTSTLGQPAEAPTLPDAASNGHGHVRPSGLIVPPGRG